MNKDFLREGSNFATVLDDTFFHHEQKMLLRMSEERDVLERIATDDEKIGNGT